MNAEILKVGLDHAAPVPLHTDYSSGDFIGYEVDLINRVAEDLGLHLEYRVSYWKDIINDLAQGKIDVICSAATVTSERQKSFRFSAPYLQFHLCVVCNTNNKIAISELSAYRIGVRESSEAKDFLLAQFPLATLEISDSNDDLYNKLTLNEIDALIDDSPIAYGMTKENQHLAIGELISGTESHYAIMMRMADAELKLEIDGVLAQLKANGFLDTIRQKWFGRALL